MNYQKQLDQILSTINNTIQTDNKKPTLLLHACCAPCSSYVLEYLSSFFDITIYYYNPNIYPKAEYSRRLQELIDFLPRFKPAIDTAVQLIQADYDPKEYFINTGTIDNIQLQNEPEKGERCRRCYFFRMKKAYQYALEHHFDWFTTTLSISPFKDAEKINTIGKQLEQDNGPAFLTSDFKKKNGFKRSLELSSEYGLYRQTYCGCLYSYKSRQEYDKTIGSSQLPNDK